MNIKKILLISLIAVAIVASVSAVSAGLFDGLMGGEEQQDNVIEIDNIQFNVTNATKFKLINETEGDAGYYKWYMDENETGYNVHIYNVSKDESQYGSVVRDYDDRNGYRSLPSQTVDGVVVYTTSANTGEHVGEPRYYAIIENHDLNTLVDFGSPDPNETAKMTLSLKFK